MPMRARGVRTVSVACVRASEISSLQEINKCWQKGSSGLPPYSSTYAAVAQFYPKLLLAIRAGNRGLRTLRLEGKSRSKSKSKSKSKIRIIIMTRSTIETLTWTRGRLILVGRVTLGALLV